MDNYYSSESEDERPPRKRRVFRPRINFDFDGKEFLESQQIGFENLYLEIGYEFQHDTERNFALSPKQQMLTALRFLGVGCQYHGVADMLGASKPTVHRCVRKFSTVVVNRLFASTIRWPQNADSTATGFYRYSGIPNVAGSVDGTLCKIQKPKNNEEQFLVRHGNHSINAMMVCAPNLKFTYVNARFPGSVHDSRVLRNSILHEQFENGWRPFPNAIIIGDSAYPLRDWLVPYRPPRPGSETEQRLFVALQRSRHLIECAYGALKSKFPCLNYLRLEPNIAALVIMTCAILHNICIDERGDDDINSFIVDMEEENLGDLPDEAGYGRSKGLDDLLRFFHTT